MSLKKLPLKGFWRVALYDENGQLKEERQGFNVVTTNGKEDLANYLNRAASAAATNTYRYIGIGTDATAEAASNTALGAQVARHTGIVSYTSGAIYEVVATFAAGVGTGAVAEYGLFNSNTAGVMLTRDTESVINKGASDTLTVTHQITIS